MTGRLDASNRARAMNGPPPRPVTKARSTYELGRRAAEQLTAAFGGRRDIQTSAIEWYRGFSRGLGGEPLPEVEAFIVKRCQRLEAGRSCSLRAELAILDVLAKSPLDLLPGIEEPLSKRQKTNGIKSRSK